MNRVTMPIVATILILISPRSWAEPEFVTAWLIESDSSLQAQAHPSNLYHEIRSRFALDIDARLIKDDDLKRAIAAGDMPDMIVGHDALSIDQINSWGLEGLLYPVDALLYTAPELDRFFAEYPDIREQNTALDGRVYNIPGGYDSPLLYGAKLPQSRPGPLHFKTPDDYRTWYDNRANANDEQVGVDDLLTPLFEAFGLGGPSVISYDDQTHRFVFPYTSPDARLAIEWARDLYASRDLDIALSGREDVPESGIDFVGIPIECTDPLTQRAVLDADLTGLKAERIMEMLDWFRSDEGHATSLFGFENRDWALVNGIPRQLYEFPENQYEFLDEWQYRIGSESEYVAWQRNWTHLNFAQELVHRWWQCDQLWLKRTPTESLSAEGNGQRPDLNLLFSKEEKQEVERLSALLHGTSLEWAADAITGRIDMSEWQDLQGELERFGVARYEELYNDAYARARVP